MQLKEWCERKGTGAIKQLAALCNVHAETMSRAVRGKHKSFDLACRISAATDGDVTIEDLLGALPEGAIWSPAQADAENLARTYGMLLSAEERALLEGEKLATKRPMATPAQMRGAA